MPRGIDAIGIVVTNSAVGDRQLSAVHNTGSAIGYVIPEDTVLNSQCAHIGDRSSVAPDPKYTRFEVGVPMPDCKSSDGYRHSLGHKKHTSSRFLSSFACLNGG